MMETIIIQNTEPAFSIFENHTAANPRTTNLAEVFQILKDPNSALVGKTRSIQTLYKSNGGGKKSKKAIAPLKAALQVVAFGATGDRKVVEKASGLICVDIDGTGEKTKEILEKLRNCPHTALCFISPSGDGIKAVVKIPVIIATNQSDIRSRFKTVFKAVARYVLENTGAMVDVACSDILRLCYLPHDAEAYLNMDAVEFDVNFDDLPPVVGIAVPTENGENGTGRTYPVEIVRPLLHSIESRPDYPIWIRVAAATSNSLNSTGQSNNFSVNSVRLTEG